MIIYDGMKGVTSEAWTAWELLGLELGETAARGGLPADMTRGGKHTTSPWQRAHYTRTNEIRAVFSALSPLGCSCPARKKTRKEAGMAQLPWNRCTVKR